MAKNNYIQLTIQVNDQQQNDILIASLSAMGFDGFEEAANQLKAFIKEIAFDKNEIISILNAREVSFTIEIIEEQNWNALWESNFQPVLVNDFCMIRAGFHQPSYSVEHDIIITPKMSFGTGHHATTFMMIQQMQNIDFKNQTVADFGTGTGILSILAEKLGAANIDAIDEDEWSIKNAAENISQNKCSKIRVTSSNTFSANRQYDIILANINKNVIWNNLDGLVFGLLPGGKLLISGILKSDEEEILKSSGQHSLIHVNTIEKSSWICMLLSH